MKRILNFIIFIGLLAGAYYGYQWWQENRGSNNTFSLIHPEAPIVLYSSNLEKDYLSLSKKPLGERLLQSSPLTTVEKIVREIGPHLLVHEYTFAKYIKSKKSALSVHFGFENTIDFVFYLSLNKKEQTIAQSALEQLARQKDNPIRSEEINGYKRYYLPSYKLYYAFFDGHLVSSKSADLLSDVYLERASPKQLNLFFKDKERSKGISTSKLLVYLNYKLLYQHAPALFRSSPDVLKHIRSLSSFTLTNISFEESAIEMNGFSYGFEDRRNFLSIFSNQQTGNIELKNLISNQTGSFLNFHIGDALKLKKSLQKYWWDNDIAVLNRWENLDENLSFELETFYSLIGSEYGIASLKNRIDKVLLINSRDGSLALRQLHQINGSTPNSVKHELYSDRKLFQSKIKDLPNLLFGNYAKGFKNSYYTSYKDYIVFGNSIQSLKLFINDLDQENVWGKSIEKARDLEKYLVNANMSYFSKVSYLKDEWEDKLNNSYPIIFGTNSIASNFEDFIFQWSYEDGKVFTNMVFSSNNKIANSSTNNYRREEIQDNYLPPTPDTKTIHTTQIESQTNSKQTISFELYTSITGKSTFAKNHAYNEPVLLAQDQAHQLFMLSTSGKVLWEQELTDEIVSDIHVVDMLANKKTQYLFATENKIHCLDRLGNELTNFPLSLKNIKSVIPVDYDGKKEYRFLAANKSGDIYLFSKTGTKVKGWFPKKTGGKLIASPKHIRIGNTDFFLAIQKSGTIHLFRRNGKEAAGFPIKLKQSLQENYNYEKGTKTTNSYIRVLTEKNQYIKVDFQGKVSKQQLIKSNQYKSVRLISNKEHTDYVYVFKNGKSISVKDRFLKKIHTTSIDITNSPYAELFVTKEAKYLSLFNEKTQKNILINFSTLSERWINSSTPISLFRIGKKLKVSTSNDNEIILKIY